jgi:hypothetical protein
MTSKPEDLLMRWLDRVNAADIEGVLALYNARAILIPTFSNRLLSGRERISEYFEALCSREALSIALHEKTLIVQSFESKLHTLCGIYCWRFAVDGEMLSFEARFSYLLDLALSNPILHHHSSQIPRTL